MDHEVVPIVVGTTGSVQMTTLVGIRNSGDRGASDDGQHDLPGSVNAQSGARQLLAIHKEIGGDKPGRRKLDVLNNAGIVLVCAFWEAFCGDLADEALAHLIEDARDPDALPAPLQKLIARAVRADKNELAPWKLAGDGWRRLLRDRAAELREQRNRALDTPQR
jgi:hypothetical protein